MPREPLGVGVTFALACISASLCGRVRRTLAATSATLAPMAAGPRYDFGEQPLGQRPDIRVTKISAGRTGPAGASEAARAAA